MKRKLLLCCLIIILNLYIPSVNAENICDDNYLQGLANNVDIHTEYDYEAEKSGVFGQNIITVTGLTNEIYALTDDKSTGFYYENMIDGVVTETITNSSIKNIKIYAINCSDKAIKTIKIALKKYNIYSSYEECEGLENELEYCSKEYQGDITYDELIKEINAYKNNNSTTSTTNNILDIIKNNYIIPVVIIIIIALIAFILYKKKKNKLD